MKDYLHTMPRYAINEKREKPKEADRKEAAILKIQEQKREQAEQERKRLEEGIQTDIFDFL